MALLELKRKLQLAGPRRMNPTLSPAALVQVELSLGVRLPDDYRQFLLEIGDGGAGPSYGMLSLAHGLKEYGEGVWSLADPFLPPQDSHDWLGFRAPGMLPIQYDGCAYFAGLVVSGPERGNVWDYIEAPPGWLPRLKREAGMRLEKQDYAALYDRMLAPANAAYRTTFVEFYEDWLDAVIQQARS